MSRSGLAPDPRQESGCETRSFPWLRLPPQGEECRRYGPLGHVHVVRELERTPPDGTDVAIVNGFQRVDVLPG